MTVIIIFLLPLFLAGPPGSRSFADLSRKKGGPVEYENWTFKTPITIKGPGHPPGAFSSRVASPLLIGSRAPGQDDKKLFHNDPIDCRKNPFLYDDLRQRGSPGPDSLTESAI